MHEHSMDSMSVKTGNNITMNMNEHNNHGMNMNGSMDHSMMMHMFFYFGVVKVPILFKEWTVNSGGEMAAACIGVCIVAMLYEGLKVLRESILKKSLDYRQVATNCDRGDLVQTSNNSSSICSRSHWLQTFLHLIQVTVSYALMLIFMTYNAYLAISIIVGAGLGYFIFGWKKAVIVDINEHCH